MWVDTNQALENDRARLEPLEMKHHPLLLPICLAYPDLLRYSPPAFGTEESFRAYFESCLQRKEKGEWSPWAIFDKKKEAYAGSTCYLNISEKDKRLEIGATWIAPPFQRTGLNRACKFLLLSHAFIGAQYEGKLRSHTLMSDGYRRDTLYYSILPDEWPVIKAKVFSK